MGGSLRGLLGCVYLWDARLVALPRLTSSEISAQVPGLWEATLSTVTPAPRNGAPIPGEAETTDRDPDQAVADSLREADL